MTDPMAGPLQRLLRAAFFICLVAVLYLALSPRPLITGSDSDKVNHILAFFALGLLLRLGWPGLHVLRSALALLLLGVLIEIAQHFVGRDAAVADVVADAAGLLLALAVLHFSRPHLPAALRR